MKLKIKKYLKHTSITKNKTRNLFQCQFWSSKFQICLIKKIKFNFIKLNINLIFFNITRNLIKLTKTNYQTQFRKIIFLKKN
jgi:hypothetical protein